MMNINDFKLPPLEEILGRAPTENKNISRSDMEISEQLYKEGFKKFLKERKIYLANEIFDKSVALNPQNYKALAYRAISNRKLGNDTNKIMEDYNNAIEICREKDESFLGLIYRNRGSIKEEMGDIDGAMEDYNNAVKTETWGEPYYNRARLKHKLGNLNDALRDCNIAIETNPDYCRYYSLRGEIRKKMGDIDGAMEDEKWAKRLNIRNYSHRNLKKYLEWQEKARDQFK